MLSSNCNLIFVSPSCLTNFSCFCRGKAYCKNAFARVLARGWNSLQSYRNSAASIPAGCSTHGVFHCVFYVIAFFLIYCKNAVITKNARILGSRISEHSSHAGGAHAAVHSEEEHE